MIDDLHQIGEVAERLGLSLRTIRYYEEEGLVLPSRRTDGGFRLYAIGGPPEVRWHLVSTGPRTKAAP